MRYRLGLDLGANSLGWTVLLLGREGAPNGLVAAGVHLFTDGRDPQTKETLAAERRAHRAMRRRRDRYLRRRLRLLAALRQAGLMPSDPAAAKALEREDPLTLRKVGLERRLTPHELGRALFHLNQRRGFKSNRQTDQDDKDAGLIQRGASALEAAMRESGCRTVGEYLYVRRSRGEWVRARPTGTGKERTYPFYPQRRMLEAEFRALWETQAKHHPELLSDALREELFRIVFQQRALKPVDPGRCSQFPDEKRAPWAQPLAQRFRLLQELANLRVIDAEQCARPLTLRERDRVLAELTGQGKDRKPKAKMGFDRLRKLLSLPPYPESRFSLEDERRRELKGDEVGTALARPTHLGPAVWAGLKEERRAALVTALLETEDEEELVAWLMAEHALSEERARHIARKSPLPGSHCRYSLKALAQLVTILEREARPDEISGQPRPIRYDEATQLAGWHHSDRRTGEIHDRMPYYAAVLPTAVVDAPATAEPEAVRHGWVANPTVHIALNQLRKVVNALIARYGHPHEIVVELGRELKLNKEQRKRINSEIQENTRRRERWRTRLAQELDMAKPRGGDFLKMRLWEEMPPERRICVLSGQQISLGQLFSDEIEVEHILPYSRSLDDGFMNKMLCFRDWNRTKGNRTPYEAFGSTAQWPEIAQRIRVLSKAKQDRFRADAIAEPGEFLARHLNDTRYLSRLATHYLRTVCHPDRVWCVPGRLTAMLRARWGLNAVLTDANFKDRTDQRHHAIDAFVVAMTDRGLLNRIARLAGQAEEAGLDRLLEELPPPWPGFSLSDFRSRIRKIVVSYRPNRSHAGSMHNDTAYGLCGEPDAKGRRRVRHRVPLASLKSRSEVEGLCDPALRARLLAYLDAPERRDEKLAAVLEAFGAETGVRRVRLYDSMTVIPILDRTGRAYKGYKGDNNWCWVIFETPRGTWSGRPISVFEAYREMAGKPPEAPPGPEVMRLFKDDPIAIDDPSGDARRLVLRVVKFSGNALVTAEHHEGGKLQQRNASADDPFKWFEKSAEWYRQHNMRQVRVSPIGRVHDFGRPPRPRARLEDRR